MKTFVLLLLALAMPTASSADEAADQEAVVQLIVDFFEAMTARDVERMRGLMTPDGIIYGYSESPEGLQIVRPTHSAYLENLATGEQELLERFWDPEVMIYDRLATVWTPYDFHRDGEFSHCGINNFSMLHTDERWVIAGVVFSIESDCEESPLGPVAAEESN